MATRNSRPIFIISACILLLYNAGVNFFHRGIPHYSFKSKSVKKFLVHGSLISNRKRPIRGYSDIFSATPCVILPINEKIFINMLIVSRELHIINVSSHYKVSSETGSLKILGKLLGNLCLKL